MLNENALMWRVALLGCALFACTKPNPESCADGSCTDPAFPFCDVDGAVAGTPEKCIAVECAPLEFELCRADDAIVCNASGNNYDVVRCELGCAGATGGCRDCATDANCTASAPVCDAETSRCRA